MERKILQLSAILVTCLSVTAFTVDFSGKQLASYEPGEMDECTVSIQKNPYNPDLTLRMEMVLGGTNGAPLATHGDYILKLEWDNEIDRKIEIRHTWHNIDFDLRGWDFIDVDVYVPGANAIPSIMGIWDNDWSIKWIDAACEPKRAKEWRTISMCVAGLNDVGIN